MLVKPHQIFADALASDYAIGAFNTSNMELSQGILRAAEKQKSPVIIQTSEGGIEYAGLKTISRIITTLAEESSVPVIMHLDHGKSLDMAKRCIEVGYTSVMIDQSTLPFDQNIKNTKEVVEYAHARGVWVEAELGAIVGNEGVKDLQGGHTPDSFLTDPNQAKKFVESTGVDALAVSVGTIHGAFSGQEYIRFELLQQIQEMIPHMPLVLHGASGISSEDLSRACVTHVCKVNVDTELRIGFEHAVKAYFDVTHDSYDPRKILGPARDAVEQVVFEKIALFGSTGTAGIY
ncbi:MAG TPA: class II fructose-1,6-bisphosphate aldolase [Candidatus Andersenbacteria bacterium]|nr:class II fructose-1,6-bisphosphate aldolase [Candidatus Andersenbacteria bacterium]